MMMVVGAISYQGTIVNGRLIVIFTINQIVQVESILINNNINTNPIQNVLPLRGNYSRFDCRDIKNADVCKRHSFGIFLLYDLVVNY